MSDIFWSERYLNSVHKKFISWLGNNLANIKLRSRKKRENYAKEWIYQLPLYVLEHAAAEVKNQYDKANLLNLIWEVKKEEKEFGNVGNIIENVLPNAENRLSNIQIRIKRIMKPHFNNEMQRLM